MAYVNYAFNSTERRHRRSSERSSMRKKNSNNKNIDIRKVEFVKRYQGPGWCFEKKKKKFNPFVPNAPFLYLLKTLETYVFLTF